MTLAEKAGYYLKSSLKWIFLSDQQHYLAVHCTSYFSSGREEKERESHFCTSLIAEQQFVRKPMQKECEAYALCTYDLYPQFSQKEVLALF